MLILIHVFYYIIISIASYMFWPPVVAIFREVFSEGILHGMLKYFANIKCYVLGKMFKIYVRI